ncbi:MAG: type III-B CRISPR module RAMP protein Cmr1 [Thermotogaceae bacterium]|nr:type III-B CRISPR module RAMP protein Cmr1 [Thermotogaceae bacterium]
MGNEPITFKIKTLTPLWTGGSDGKMDRIHETGIIGSIRWWYEVIARGLGYYVCDPTSDNRCKLSGKERDTAERISKLCPACYLFGTTGWKRMFNLPVTIDGKQPVRGNELFSQATTNSINKNWLSKVFEKNRDDMNYFGSLELRVLPRCDRNQIEKQLKAVLSIMSNFGSLGAKPQFGYGLFELSDDTEETKESLRIINRFLKENCFVKRSDDNKGFSLKNYWKIETEVGKSFPPANLKYLGSEVKNLYIPMSFDVRYMLRKEYLESSKSKKATAEIFGGTKGDKWASKVFVSSFYKEDQQNDKYKLRIWGFTERSVPEIVREAIERDYDTNNVGEISSFGKMLSEVTEIDSRL